MDWSCAPATATRTSGAETCSEKDTHPSGCRLRPCVPSPTSFLTDSCPGHLTPRACPGATRDWPDRRVATVRYTHLTVHTGPLCRGHRVLSSPSDRGTGNVPSLRQGRGQGAASPADTALGTAGGRRPRAQGGNTWVLFGPRLKRKHPPPPARILFLPEARLPTCLQRPRQTSAVKEWREEGQGKKEGWKWEEGWYTVDGWRKG